MAYLEEILMVEFTDDEGDELYWYTPYLPSPFYSYIP